MTRSNICSPPGISLIWFITASFWRIRFCMLVGSLMVSMSISTVAGSFRVASICGFFSSTLRKPGSDFSILMNKSGLSLKADIRPLAAVREGDTLLLCEDEPKGKLPKGLEGVLVEVGTALLVVLVTLDDEGTEAAGVLFGIRTSIQLHTTTFGSSLFTVDDSSFTGAVCVPFAVLPLFFFMVTM